MGKYRDGRRVAIQGGRALQARVENLVKSGAIAPPPWLEAMKHHPPPTLPFWAPKPQELVFPEDKLFRIYMARNPEWKDEVLRMHPKAKAEGTDKSRGYLFCNLWQKYIDEGMPQEDAYKKVEQEFKAVEAKVEAQADAELLKQIMANDIPRYSELLAEEEKYVNEALDYHKKAWEAQKRKAMQSETESHAVKDD